MVVMVVGKRERGVSLSRFGVRCMDVGGIHGHEVLFLTKKTATNFFLEKSHVFAVRNQ